LAWRLFPALRKSPEVSGPEVSAPDALGPDISGPARSGAQRPALDRRLYAEMARESWPLMLNHLFATLFFKIDVFLMESILGSEMLGRYQIGYKLLETLMVIPSMFTMALFPVISRQAEDDRETMVRFYRLGAKILVLLALPAALVTTVLAREMVLILGGPEYLPGAMVALRFMAWSMPISWVNGITQYVLIALNRQRYLTRAYILGFGFSLVANLMLMPRFGYRASALLHIFAELVLFIPFVLGVQRELRSVGWWTMLGKPVLAALIAGGVGWLLLGLGRFVAVAGVLVIYGGLVWALGVLNTEERETLAPLLRRV
jgi:O-antigen/teichoic acid export membrane protein